jgi:hypothetical protein
MAFAGRCMALAMALVLAGCGGDGGGDTPAPTAGTLFLSDPSTGSIAAYPTLVPAAGASFDAGVVASAPALSYDAAHRSWSMQPLAYDAARDELYVGGVGGVLDPYPSFAAVRVYAHASTGATPTRIFWSDKLQAIRQLFLDPATDSLTVTGDSSLRVGSEDLLEVDRFANASTVSGIVDPAALPVPWPAVRANGLSSVLAFDSGRDVFYASHLYADFVGTIAPGIGVFAQASSAPAAPTRMLAAPASPYALALDTMHDTLFATDRQGLWIVRNASTTAPTTIGPIAMTGAYGVAVDPRNDRLYVAGNQALYVFEHASALTAASVLPAPAVRDAAGPDNAIFGIAFR